MFFGFGDAAVVCMYSAHISVGTSIDGYFRDRQYVLLLLLPFSHLQAYVLAMDSRRDLLPIHFACKSSYMRH